MVFYDFVNKLLSWLLIHLQSGKKTMKIKYQHKFIISILWNFHYCSKNSLR